MKIKIKLNETAPKRSRRSRFWRRLVKRYWAPPVKRRVIILGSLLIMLVGLSFAVKWHAMPRLSFLHDPEHLYEDLVMREFTKADSSASDVDVFGGGSNHDSRKVFRERLPYYPTAVHWLGTDSHGRDTLSRILAAMRIYFYPTSLLALFLPALAGGTLAAIVLGYFAENKELRFARYLLANGLVRPLSSFPKLIGIFLFLAIARINIFSIMLILGVMNIPRVATSLKIKIDALRREKFIEACRGLGLGHGRILFKHILWHNCRWVYVALGFIMLAEAILLDAGLAFFGRGDPRSLGSMVASEKGMIFKGFYEWIMNPHTHYDAKTFAGVFGAPTFPALAIIGLILLLYHFGDALARWADPKRRMM